MAVKKMVQGVLVVGLVVVVMNVCGAVSVEGAISCNQVVSAMTPCTTYLLGNAVVVMNVWGAVSVECAISCNQVVSAMTPCATYLLGNAVATPAAACYPSIRGLDSQVKATPDRQAVSNCFNTQAQSFGVKLGKASNLPGLWRVTDLNVPISPVPRFIHEV